MARGRGGSRPRGRGRGGASRGRGGFPRQRRSNFQTSRIEDIEGGFNGSVDSDAIDDDGSYAHDEDQETEPESDEDVHPENSYSALLHALRAHQPEENLPRKRRKLSNGHSGGTHQAPGKNIDTNAAQEVRSGSDNSQKNESHDLLDVEDDEVDTENDEGAAEGSSGDEDDPRDPFEQQYGAVNEHLLVEGINAMKRKEQVLSNQKIADGVSIVYSEYARWPRISRHEAEASIKKRLIQPASEIANTLSKVDDDLRISLLSYRDVLYGCRNLSNAVRLRDTVSLHAINHIFKTRDRVIKNNAKLSQQTNADLLDVRDQGFTRPKVLVLLPTRQACIKFIESVVRSSQPEQQENKSRFTEGFAGQDDKTWEDKPEDFQDLFGGNDDDMFRLGLKFTRKTIKYFSAFYNSDIILASPLGLMRAIEGGKDKDEKKKQDADFLSSIEIAIVDHTNALLMQNWQHVEHIFSQLNLLPKESHGCDFSRVRNWYLDGHSKYLRQTIILSDYLTPEINSLSSKHLLNIAGRVKYTPHYNGAMLHLPPTLPTTLSQSFTRFTSSAPMADHDARFAHFTATILPSLLHHKSFAPGTLIYMPIYVDFVRLRNHLSTTTTLSFGSISEYSSVRDVARARSHFLSGRHSVLIYAERAHHFRRYAIRGVKRVVFYGVPENPIFWGEVVGFLGGLDGRSGRGAVRAIFSKWDVMKLERIVGTERVGKLLSEKGGDTFEFA